MKKLLLCLIVITNYTAATAKGTYIGLRTGVADWYHINTYEAFYIRTASESECKTWQNEFFIRRDSRNRVSYEAYLSYYAYNYGHINDNTNSRYSNDEHIISSFSVQQISFDYGLRIQVDITNYKLTEKLPFLSKFKSFIGVNIGNVSFDGRYTLHRYSVDSNRTRSSRGHIMDKSKSYIGINNNLSYNLSDKIALNSTTNLNIYANDFYKIKSIPGYYYKNSMINWMLGVSLKL